MSVSRKGGHGSEERLPAHRKAPRPHPDDHRLTNVPSTPEEAHGVLRATLMQSSAIL